jgi:hypothetical protein
MAKKQTKSAKVTLPEPGAVFLMPLEDGRYGVCRVLRENTEKERQGHGCPCILVAASPWIGPEAPDLSDPHLREIQKLTHHAWKNAPNVCWVSEPPPESFQRLGTIEPSATDKRCHCGVFGGWYFAFHVLMEWRWAHDLEAVLREDAAHAEKQAREYEEAERRRREARGALTLDGLRKKRRFADWKGYAPDKAITACRAIFRDTIDAVLALGNKPKGRNRRAIFPILQACIERLNKLDEQCDHFIETTIREDLCEEFDEVVHACGLRNLEDLADEWRAW